VITYDSSATPQRSQLKKDSMLLPPLLTKTGKLSLISFMMKACEGILHEAKKEMD